MTDHAPILSANAIIKQFQVKSATASGGLLRAVDGVSLDIFHGETVGIAGESGCGKTTLGKIMAGLLNPDQGTVSFHGRPLADMNRQEYGLFRRQTQMIFQDPFSSLNPRMRIGDTIGEPLLLAGIRDRATRRAKTETIMQSVGLTSDHFNRFPHEFSGGQRQRIGIARALSADPAVIIADEPVSSLDISIQAQIINLLQEMKSAFNLSLAIVSHDLSVLRHLCDRVCIMYLGAVVETAPASLLFSNCRHPYTEALISAVPRINPGATRRATVLKDDIPSPLNIPSGCRFHPRCRYARDICRHTPPPLEEKQPGHLAACHFSL
ncbi:MAG TPA: ATP-binding cassette domain-containing protein [Deltaproteobacteria bacterium]|mgnify:CR=1 FL=1|nr:ATP-binding cassette domain-containing protein [Deltaproteobacteria bacterium]